MNHSQFTWKTYTWGVAEDKNFAIEHLWVERLVKLTCLNGISGKGKPYACASAAQAMFCLLPVPRIFFLSYVKGLYSLSTAAARVAWFTKG
jgi:hypothetical protein